MAILAAANVLLEVDLFGVLIDLSRASSFRDLNAKDSGQCIRWFHASEIARAARKSPRTANLAEIGSVYVAIRKAIESDKEWKRIFAKEAATKLRGVLENWGCRIGVRTTLREQGVLSALEVKLAAYPWLWPMWKHGEQAPDPTRFRVYRLEDRLERLGSSDFKPSLRLTLEKTDWGLEQPPRCRVDPDPPAPQGRRDIEFLHQVVEHVIDTEGLPFIPTNTSGLADLATTGIAMKDWLLDDTMVVPDKARLNDLNGRLEELALHLGGTDKSPRVVLVASEPGIGKTTLAAVLKKRLLAKKIDFQEFPLNFSSVWPRRAIPRYLKKLQDDVAVSAKPSVVVVDEVDVSLAGEHFFGSLLSILEPTTPPTMPSVWFVIASRASGVAQLRQMFWPKEKFADLASRVWDEVGLVGPQSAKEVAILAAGLTKDVAGSLTSLDADVAAYLALWFQRNTIRELRQLLRRRPNKATFTWADLEKVDPSASATKKLIPASVFAGLVGRPIQITW